MHPKLKNSRVRGTPEDYFLHDVKRRQSYALEEIHAQTLSCCNGSNTIEDIAAIMCQPPEDVEEFLRVLSGAGLLDMHNPVPELFPPLTKAPYLREIQFDATGRCNLFGICKHCYGRPVFEKNAKGELNVAEMHAFIDEMAQANVSNCFLSGGEIFLRKDLPEMIRHLSDKYVCLDGIFTNGTIWRQEVIDTILATGVATAFLVSMDGHTPALNDFMRGKGNFEKTLRFVRKIKETNLPLTVNTMVTKQTVESLGEMYRFMESLGVSRWRLSIPREQGETVVNRDLIMPSWEAIFIAYDKLLRTVLDKPGKMRIQLSSVFKTEFVEEGRIYLFNPGNNCCEYKRWGLTIKPSGDIVPCSAFDDFVFGNIRKQHLLDVWYADTTQSFKALPVDAITGCKGCDLLSLCGGGCRKMAYHLHKDILAKDDYSCPMYRFFTETVFPLLKQHGVEVEYLPERPVYNYDPTIINEALSLAR
ncbi:SPASM domain-containing protein [Patescibacteria group bacterium]|nr:SPASM domain-containing protein [Patescibacteria group bacterium]